MKKKVGKLVGHRGALIFDFCGYLLSRLLYNSKVSVTVFLGLPTIAFSIWWWRWKPPKDAVIQAANLENLLSAFVNQHSAFLSLWGVFFSVVFAFAPALNKRYAETQRLRRTQKERIRVLDDFAPTGRMLKFFDNRSIYEAIIAMLNRLQRAEGISEKGKRQYQVCMLLCSPALDYPDNPNSNIWGEEFRTQVRNLVQKDGIHFEVCHLPLHSSLGVNAMKDFIAVLASYVTPKNGNFQAVYDKLWLRAELCAKDFFRMATEDEDVKERFRVHTHTINIPFQIVLVTGKELKEVVVSFAGREVLGREQKHGIKGFFSSDPYVVETFQEVFETYVQSEGRIPYIPPHTLRVSEEHDNKGNHIIPNYYHGLVENLHVLKDAFSPAIGNSTKFTVWLLDKFLPEWHENNPIKRVLDVGSGTGILALATDAILSRQGSRTHRIIAIDSSPHAQQILPINCQGKPIDIRAWELCYNKDAAVGKITNSWFQDGGNIIEECKVDKFELIIADLPFVHAETRASKGNADFRFLDLHHDLHRALFVASKKHLDRKGLLITVFSSLGGPEDMANFERYIRESDLQVIQRVDFYESDYMWTVYALMRKDGFDDHNGQLWWTALGANKTENWDGLIG